PPLLVMELATGKVHTVDGICRGGRLVLGHAKTREAMRAGLAMYFETAAQPELEAAARRLVAARELDWCVNVQFIGEHLLEINPRISTIVYQDDLNLPYLAVRHALGELDEEQLGAYAGAGPAPRWAVETGGGRAGAPVPGAPRAARSATTTRSSTTSRERPRRPSRAPAD